MNREIIIRIILIFIIFIIPLILTLIVRVSRQITYEFVDEKGKRMVAPSTPFPYLSQLFSDLFLQLKMNWCSFCIQNNCYSKEHSLPFDIGVRLEGMNDFITIHYGETDCFPIFKEDVFYDVAPGQFVIPSREWMKEHFNNGQISFKMTDVMNFKVYSKLSLTATVIIYILFVLTFFGFIEFFISLYKLIVLLKP